MKIRKKVLNKINNTKSRMRIAVALGLTEQAIYVQLKKNNHNGRLTKMDALQAIAEETGYKTVEILEAERASNVMGDQR